MPTPWLDRKSEGWPGCAAAREHARLVCDDYLIDIGWNELLDGYLTRSSNASGTSFGAFP